MDAKEKNVEAKAGFDQGSKLASQCLYEPTGKLKVVGVGDIQMSNRLEETIITYSLGSCIGLTLYDPVQKVGGMLHAMLPTVKMSRGQHIDKPGIFVDTGVDRMLRGLERMGACKERLIARIAGCSRTFPEDGIFEIGDKNYAVLKQRLWDLNIFIRGEDVGGVNWRTLSLRMETGETFLKTSVGWRVL
ncbi:MAG: chemotaxis protein CheD [Candidatus Omnitrophica bacterium]|nr:chemotaxis protein CheD [Candidatus Omnitrophota bacterium]MCA9414849.1 chemotaxis protein CheD [Candidatus Omnitrophota bacterium]MCA9425311.1 chemotaxis protein CheD [Candidatus Omnitrophota bacterium]MCA9430015.1 chemotaxis protein CheD [Candidatus Omnitrophota bacterium]MCA9434226.1 chemotaxis protein CheD [Candidatus Omnitrophota bacterium]